MFKKLSIYQVAEIFMCLLNSEDLKEILHVQECVEILFRESKSPKYCYRDFTDVIELADEHTRSTIVKFDNTPDYLFSAVNSRKINMDRLVEIVGLCIMAKVIMEPA